MSMDNMSKRARKRALRRHTRREDERTTSRLIMEQLEEAADEAAERKIEAQRRLLIAHGYNPETGKAYASVQEFGIELKKLGELSPEEVIVAGSTYFALDYADDMKQIFGDDFMESRVPRELALV